jgi:hypothetical protein
MGLYSGMIEPYYAYYDTATITAVKSFIVQAPGASDVKQFAEQLSSLLR